MKWRMAGAALLVATALGAAWWLWAPGASAKRVPTSEAAASIESTQAEPVGFASSAPESVGERPAASEFEPTSLPASQTMAVAREHGDDRAPPIERPLPESQAPAPTAWDLSDPARYREYELRGQRRLRAEYLMAAEQELPRWKAMLAQARATGAPPAAIAEAEEKIRRLEARQVMLRNGK